MTTDINWMVTVPSGRLPWWYKGSPGIEGHQVKGTVSLVSDGVSFRIGYDGDLVDSNSETLAVVRPVKGSIRLPSCGSNWKLEHKKIKSSNAKGRAIMISFDDQHDMLDRIQVSFPIIDDDNGTVDDGKLFIKAIQKALEERGGNKSVTGCLPQP